MVRQLFVVAKRPAPGHTKTRLCPPLSHEMAAELYTCFLQDTLDIMRQVPGVNRSIAYSPDDALAYFQTLAPDMRLQPQSGGTLGERLDHLLSDALQQGATHAVVMDSDSPTLPAAYITAAYNSLAAGADVVLGPCRDGGYYLIGVNQPQPRLFKEIAMSTPTVLRDTLALANTLGLHSTLLSPWYDVDTIDELKVLHLELEHTSEDIAPATRKWLQHQYGKWIQG